MNKRIEDILVESAKMSSYKNYNYLKDYILRTYTSIPLTELDVIISSWMGVLNIKNSYFEDWMVTFLKEMILNDVDLKDLIKIN